MPRTRFPAVIDLSELTGKNGFAIHGEAADDRGSESVSYVGDLNGDGFNDVIIGAAFADPNGKSMAGSSYVVFGHNGAWPSFLNVADLNGETGFKINGKTAGDMSGFSVSGAGDINGDGFADLIIGAKAADVGSIVQAGSSYVIFGHNGVWPSVLELSTLNGGSGFKINGEGSLDHSGVSVSGAGDLNGDGFDDILIGADGADLDLTFSVGATYIIFGHNGTWPSVLALSALDGVTGVKINGEVANDYSGCSVSDVGDVNGDGIADIIIGAKSADPDGKTTAGASYVVFGHHGAWPSVLELSALDGTNGFKINGETAGDRSGVAVSGVGDINGDGFSDVVIGADWADPDGKQSAGSGFVVFGHAGPWPSSVELSALDGVTGFKMEGEVKDDRCGIAVGGVNDINGDGFADVVIGAYYADTGEESGSGSTYAIFGHNGTWPSVIALTTLDGEVGFEVIGAMMSDMSGIAVSDAGDVNGDGLNDLMIGAVGADPDGKSNAGAGYIIFGDIYTADFTTNQLTICENETRTITLENLNAIDTQHEEIWFMISDLAHGYFEDISDIGSSITFFSKAAIASNQIRFVHDGSEFPPAYRVTVRSEKFGSSETLPAVVSFTQVNDVPVVTTTTEPLIYIERDNAAVDAGITVADADHVDLVNATIAMTNNFYSYQDVLGFTDQLGINSIYNDVSGILVLTGVSSLENYQIALRNVTYQNLSEDPITDTRTVTFVINDGVDSSLPAMRDITVIAVNNRPTLIVKNTTLNYVENSGVVAIDPDVIVIDPDANNLVNATVFITNHFYASEDVLEFTDQHGIIGLYQSELGRLDLTGIASVNDYQLALRNVTYENLSEKPSLGLRTVLFVVHDGFNSSLPEARDIQLIGVGDCPVLTGGGEALVYTEDDASMTIDNNIAISDLDSTQLISGTVSVAEHFYSGQDVLHFVNQNGISGNYSQETGVLTLTGTASLSDYQTALRTISYENLSQDPAADTRTIAFSVYDGSCNSNIITRNIQIIPENNRPTFIHNRLTITEGYNVTLTSNELSATDVDCDDEALIFTVNTVQHGEFRSAQVADQGLTTFMQQNITQGDIYFQHDGGSQAPAYFVRVSDGELTNIDGFQPASITFIPFDDLPVLIHNQLTVYRGQSQYLTSTDLSAVDEETANENLVFTVSHLQHGYFEDVLTATQVLTFVQNKIGQTEIRFAHDGTANAPSYAVSVSDGVNVLPPANAVITFIEKDPATVVTSEGIFENTLYRALIIGGVSGFIGLVFLIARICLYRKATKSIERLTDASQMGTTMEQQKDFQKNVLRPIAKAIFDRIKITGCMGYISDNRMQDYLNAVMRIVVELQQQGITVELERLKPAGQTLLINEIAKQTEQILLPKQGCCSCGSCLRCLGRLCCMEVSPEAIERNARRIAVAVRTSLQRSNFDAFLLRQSVTDSVDVNFKMREMPFDMEALRHAGTFATPVSRAVPREIFSGSLRNDSEPMPMTYTFSQEMPMPIEEAGPAMTSFSRDLSQRSFMQHRMRPR